MAPPLPQLARRVTGGAGAGAGTAPGGASQTGRLVMWLRVGLAARGAVAGAWRGGEGRGSGLVCTWRAGKTSLVWEAGAELGALATVGMHTCCATIAGLANCC